MPRAAMSVATRTRTAPDLKSFNARSRWFCERLEWIVPVLIPLLSRRRAILSAPCLVRRKNKNGVELRIGQEMKQ